VNTETPKTRVTPKTPTTATDVYQEGLAQAKLDESRWRTRARGVSNARLACFVLLVGVGWLAFGTHQLERAWILAPATAFVALIIVHDRLLRHEDRTQRIRRFFEDGLARLEYSWAGRGDAGERYRDPHHPYADDLDLFGHGSLFELLATTRTAGGSDELASWLLAPADPETIRARQAAIEELRPRLDLRLEMAIAGDEAGAGRQRGSLEAWASAPPASLHASIRPLAILATALSSGGVLLWIFSGSGPLPFVAAVSAQAIFALCLRSRVVPVLDAAETPVRSLARTAALLSCVESERFVSPRLQTLGAELQTTGHPPSAELEGLRRLVDRRDARRNQFFAPIAAFLLWGTHVALGLEAWRARCGPRLGSWIAAASEIEALVALANFSFENPEDPFPTIREGDSVFEGEALGHPLLHRDQCVRNDLALGRTPQALVMSGSNMSGKSTLLRTVGINAVLALAGAPVCARKLELSPLAIGASIQLRDSLLEGSSRFYAEILRLRQITEISAGPLPALFLLDEILHGTNSHDRGIGAQAVVHTLVENGGIGLVTTHDLALTRVADALAPRAENVHFQDHLEQGAIVFDYRMHPGVVTKSNALALMRAVGLDV
jgi:hypothetical protein